MKSPILIALVILSVMEVTGCGGGSSGSSSAPPSNPVPSITSLSPSSATAGAAAFTLTVNGGNFISNSTVQWNGASLTTTFVSATQLTAAVTATNISAAGTANITATNPSPGGGTSATTSFAIDNPIPVASSLSPTSVLQGGAPFTLTVNGSSFVSSSAVQWNGASLATTFVSATQLTAAVPAAEVATAGAANVAVVNPEPGGGTSQALGFTTTAPVPTVSISFNPGSTLAGETAALSWSSRNATSCAASGAWAGTQQVNGNETVTQNVPGAYAYNLACTGPGGTANGSAALTVNPHVLVDASTVGSVINTDQFGANMNVGFDITSPASQATTLSSVGVGLVRWPGGSPSDDYHWQANTWSASPCSAGSPNPNSTFEDFEQTIVTSGNFDVAITLNYGSNPACNGPADPNEAAGWVAYAKQNRYAIKYWTVGNEVYSATETDLHLTGAHDPTTYANNVATQFYPLIKAQDPNAQVGVVVDGGNYTSDNWDSIVLASAKYDFVEVHYYPENPGSESDSFLLTQAPANYASTFAKIKQELASAGHPNIPILLGEYNSPNYNPGKQTMSIVNALFIGMVQGEIMKAGIPAATIEEAAFNPACNTTGNNSSSLYGWQDFGSYELFAGTDFTCPNSATIPVDTPLPIAQAFGLSTQFGVPGNPVLGVSVSTALSNVRAYSAQQGTGYSLMLFNLDQSNSVTLTVGITNATKASFSAEMATYDKAVYDESQSNDWAAPTTAQLGTVTLPVTLTLQPWSMNVVVLQ